MQPEAGLREIVRYRDWLEKSQWWPRERLLVWQGRQLARLVAHARQHVPYYAERLAGLRPGSKPGDLWRAIPRLTKAQVRAHAAALRSRTPDASVLPRSSSGSTGQPLTIVKDIRPRLALWAIKLRGYAWFKTDFLGKRLRMAAPSAGEARGAVLRYENWGSPLAALFKTGLECVADVFLSVERQIALLEAEQPHYLITYPGNLQLLLRELRRRGRRLPSLRYVQTQGAQLDPDLRAECREVLGVPLYDIYGSAEGDWLAVQCPEHAHYHVQGELNFVEVLTDGGRPCRPGEVGRVVVTPLHAYAMPLLRYEMEDYAEAGEPCACGRGLPVVTRILGRKRGLLTLPSGEKRMAPFGTSIFAAMPAVRQFRMAQTGLQEIEVRLVLERALSEEEGAHIARGVSNQLPPGYKVSLKPVAELPRSASGKFEEFVSEIREA